MLRLTITLSNFANYFSPLGRKRVPTGPEVWRSLQDHRRLIQQKKSSGPSHKENTQVEQNESSTRNIKSNLDDSSTSRTTHFLSGSRLVRRGERTVPQRYLKSALWLTVGGDTGYFASNKGAYFPVEFNYDHCYWYCVKYSEVRSSWESLRLPPPEYLLDIQNEEIVP